VAVCGGTATICFQFINTATGDRLQSPVAQHTIHIARRTLSDVQLTQYDMLP